MKENLKLEIRWVNPEVLKPYENNAKEHPAEHIDQLAHLIDEFGFDQPITCDETMVIITGHGRRTAAMKLGLKEDPVIVRSDLTLEQKIAKRIADNKVSSLKYDENKLAFDVGTLQRLGFNLKFTALAERELKRLEEINQLKDLDELGGGKGKGEDEQTKNYGVNYTIVFEDLDQQQVWFDFLGALKRWYPEANTIADRLVKYVEENPVSV